MKFLVLLLGTVLCVGTWAQASWRLSDALGSDRGAAPRGSATGWILRVEPRTGGQLKTLFHDGKEDSQQLIDFDEAGRVSRVQERRAGLPVWEVTYDPAAALPLTETSFDAGQPSEIATLEFEGRLLHRRTVTDASGGFLYRDTLGRWPDGSLRRLERDGPDGAALAEAAWSYGDRHQLVEAWSIDEDAKTRGEHREMTYEKGKTSETLATAAEVLMTRVSEELEAGSKETRTLPATQTVQERLLDNKGRVTEESVTVKGVLTQTRRWTYDDRGRVVTASTESAGPVEVSTYEYPGDTQVMRLTRGGTLVREEVSRDGEKVSVSLYDRGELFLVETWTAGKRTKETYYQKGVVVRERTP